MRRIFAAFLTVLLALALGAEGFSARRTAKRARSASVRTNVSGALNTKSGTFTPASPQIVVSSGAPAPGTSAPAACGVPASADDMATKRQCALAYAEALGIYCNAVDGGKKIPCNSALKLAMTLNFGIAMLAGVKAGVGGVECKGAGLDKLCEPFAEELVAGLFPLYSDSAIKARKICNAAKARFQSAQDCFAYIQTTRTGNFGGSADEDGINGRCGREALLAKYEAIALDPIASEDERLLLKENVNTAWGAKTLSSDIATKFANVGSGSWNFSGMAGKFLDTKWDFKSSTYPREIVMLVNAFVTEGETACGKSFRADMQETGFNLDSSLSSLEREIQKNGILKGLFDYGVNQIAAVKGEAWAQEMKEGGLGGIGKKECAYKSDIVVMLSDGKAVPAKIREMISALEIMRDGATNNKSAKNCYNIIYGDLQIIFENYTVTKDGKEKKISDVAPIDGFSGSDSSIDDAIGRLDQIKDASFEPKDAPAKPEEISYNITPVDMEGKEWSEIIRITKEKIEKTNKEFISAINGKTLNPSIDTTDWPTSGSPETAPPG